MLKPNGLHLDCRQRKDCLTIYVRGRLLRELLALLRDLYPGLSRELNAPTMLNLRKTFGITSRAQAEVWVRDHHRYLMRRRNGGRPGITMGRALERYEQHLRAPRERPYAESSVKVLLIAARRVRDQLGAGRLVGTVRESDLEPALAAAIAGSSAAETRKAARSRVRGFFLWALDHGLTPLLSYEALSRAMRPERGGVGRKVRARWLRPAEVGAILAAVAGHPLEGLVRLLLLTGPRKHSALSLRWEPGGPEEGWVDLDARVIHYWSKKTRSHHVWRLRWSPSIETWLHDQPRIGELVFHGITEHRANYLVRRSRRVDGRMTHVDGVLRRAVPGVRLKDLRSTAATYLHCSPGIPGGTMEKALAMGHSPATAGAKYVNPSCLVSAGASTLEQAMGIEPLPDRAQPVHAQALRR